MVKKICLVAEDSAVIRKISRKILEGLGFDVIEAADGKQALDVLEKTIPQVVLLDWHMPVMSGLEFLVELRKKYSTSEIPVIFCTTENDIIKIMTAIEAGANEYIMKPFDEEILKTKLMQMRLIK